MESTEKYILHIYMCCWNVATYKWKVHNGKIEIISFWHKLELIFQKVAIDTINTIEEITRGQRGNPEWFNFRRGRINASLFPSVANFGFSDSPDNYIVKQIMN